MWRPVSFLILGAEPPRPEGMVPEENVVAEVLGELLGGVWGRVGFWCTVLAGLFFAVFAVAYVVQLMA